MTVIIFLLVLLVCVIAHEWGHFFAARKSGMIVEEFGFGIPPRLWSRKKGDTVYSINALPIGGFVKIAGENGIEAGIPENRQFDSKPWYLKSIVLVAGVLCNLILALILFTTAYTLGMPAVTPSGTPTIVAVSANSPAEKAGIVVGDEITRVVIDGTEIQVLSTDTLRTAIQKNAQKIVIDVVHGGQKKEVTLTPEVSGENRMIGLAVEPIGIVKEPLGQAIADAWHQVISLIVSIWQTLAGLVGGLFSSQSTVSGLIGPVGLAREVRGAATIGFTYLLAFTAVISVNLAVLNIMPFPALDGGRLLVVLLEAVFRKKFSRKIVGYIHALGFLLLILLMLVLTVGDIRKLL